MMQIMLQQQSNQIFIHELTISFAMNDLSKMFPHMDYECAFEIAAKLKTTKPDFWDAWNKELLQSINATYWNTIFH
jgi:hypothetical protein